MLKSLKILLVFFLFILVPSNSYSVVSSLSKTGKLIFKSKSAAKAGSGVAVTDNVASQVLDSGKLNKNVLDKLAKERNIEYLNSIKNNSDETILSEHKYYNDPNIKDDPLYIHAIPSWRLNRADIKPENSVYVCNANNINYYFSLLPKRNKALLFNKESENPKQRLNIELSNIKGTILSTHNINSKQYFILLPNYKFYTVSATSIQELKNNLDKNLIVSNGECFDTDLKDKSFFRYDLAKINQQKEKIARLESLEQSNKAALNKNKEQKEKEINNDETISYLPFYLILAFIFYAITVHYIDKFLNKNTKLFKKSKYLIMSNHILGLIFLNIVGVISISGYVAINFIWYLETFLLISFLFYLFATFLHFRNGYSILKLNNHKILSSLETKLFYYPNFIVPGLFLTFIIFFNFR
jgi:hypothetical protein